jgi:hypothetical protein
MGTRSRSNPPRHKVGARRRRGFTFEEPLALAVILGAFVYPLSLGARAAGEAVADQVEEAHEKLLTPPNEKP